MSPEPTERATLDAFARLGGLEAVREALAGEAGWLVGGTVRDLALGREVADLDVVVEGDPVGVAHRLGGKTTAHDRFGTVSVRGAGPEIDLARARSETYPAPGALPEVRPGSLTEDLARRDFTVNAMAIPLTLEPELVDPHHGLADVRAGVLRALHDRSFVHDPTRAIRAARYAARLRFDPDPQTERLLRATDLNTVTADRVESELRKLGRELDALRALGLLADWGLINADVDLAGTAVEAARSARFAGIDIPAVLLMAGDVRAGRFAAAPMDRARELASLPRKSAAELTAAAHGARDVDLAVARALGAKWIDAYMDDWRTVRLEISGGDLMKAGVPEGPAVGAGLTAALRRKLNGEISGRDAELEAALEAAK